MARILPLFAMLVVAIMKSTPSTAATTTAEGTTELETTMVTDSGPTLNQTKMVTSMSSETNGTMSSSGTTVQVTNTTDPIPSSSPLPTSTDSGPTLNQTEMVTSMSSDTNGTMSSSGTTVQVTNTTDPISSSSSMLTATDTDATTLSPFTKTLDTGPTDLSTEPTIGTTTDSRKGSTTEPTTKPPTEPSTEEPPRVGPVPEPTLPDIDGDANKTYQFEFAVEEPTPEGCTSDSLTSPDCDTFMYNVTQELEAVYGESDAFESVEVVLIPGNGSLIVSHTVTYSYNEMSDEERMASAQDIYDDTLGSAVADGNLGDYTVQEDCGSCAPPAETSAISSRTAKCPSEYSEPAFKNNYWVCESTCFTNRDYCNLHGFCWQRGNFYSQPICSCDWDNGEWYWGYRCQYYMNQMHLIIGCSCGAAVLLVLLACLIACCVVTPKAISDKDSQSSESVIDLFLPPIDDTNNGKTLQGNRPYSYIYSGKLGESSGFIGNQNGGAQRESRPEVSEDAAKRQSNDSADNRHSSLMKPSGSSQQRNPEFWGNLNEPSAEHIKLEPFLHDNDSHKIQRPHISGHYDYSNTEPNAYQSMNPAHTQHIPEPDYYQR